MRIVSIDATHPTPPTEPNDWRGWLGQIAVRVVTEDGLVGLGVGGGGEAGVHVVQTVLRSVLLGENAEEIEVLHARMRRATMAFGPAGLASMALSGVDLALWDLRAKRAGVPVWRLLGAGQARPVPAYLTGGDFDDVLAGRTSGVTAFKFGIAGSDEATFDRLVADLSRLRSMLGPDVALMTDATMRLTVDATLRLADRLAPLGVAWIEEPLPPDDLEGHARLRDECPVPIAGGEHIFTERAFETLIRERLLSTVQPDVCWCGGLTTLLRVYELGREHRVDVCPHRGAEVWSLHAIAAVDPAPLAESGRPWMSWVAGQPAIDGGRIAPPEGPGFGVTFADA